MERKESDKVRIRLNDEEMELFKKCADSLDVSMSAVGRLALSTAIWKRYMTNTESMYDLNKISTEDASNEIDVVLGPEHRGYLKKYSIVKKYKSAVVRSLVVEELAELAELRGIMS